VPTIAYLPFNFFCWITPIVSMLYGWFNITIDPLEEEAEIPGMVAEKGTANSNAIRIQASEEKGQRR
jgi:NhaC family Na+:H+ antiporter